MDADKIVVAATVGRLREVIDFVERKAERFGLAPKKKMGALIAVEEVFVNICSYAFPQGEGAVEVSSTVQADTWALEIADAGRPFDPLALPDPDITADIAKRKIGGLGVYFIRSLSDDVGYRWENGRNIVRLEFKRPPEDGC